MVVKCQKEQLSPLRHLLFDRHITNQNAESKPLCSKSISANEENAGKGSLSICARLCTDPDDIFSPEMELENPLPKSAGLSATNGAVGTAADANVHMATVHFVGSVALDTPEEVYAAIGKYCGPYLKRIPDGEPGGRRLWISWQIPVLRANPSLAQVGEIGRASCRERVL